MPVGSDYHEEEALGKAYDSRLMRRLLTYAKPFWALIVAAVALLLVTTVTDLARPYVLKTAIDDHLMGSSAPMVSLDAGEAIAQRVQQLVGPVRVVRYGGRLFVRERFLPEALKEELAGAAGVQRVQIWRSGGQTYLVEGVLDAASTAAGELAGEPGEPVVVPAGPERFEVHRNGAVYPATLLRAEEAEAFRAQDVSGLRRLGLLLLVLMVVGFAVQYAQVYLLQYTGQRIIFNMRQHIFRHLQAQSLAFFDRHPVGRLVTRVTNDTETLNEMYTAVLVNLFKDAFLVVGIIVVMFRLHRGLAWLSLAMIPVVVAVTVLFRIQARDAYRQVRTRLARINATLAENLSGMRIVQVFAQEGRQYRHFDEINRSHYQAGMRELTIFAVFRPAIEMLASLTLAILLWFGGVRVVGGGLEFGVLYAFIDYVRQLFQPINDLTEKYNILQSAMASSERIFHLLDTHQEIRPPAQPRAVGRFRGAVEFDRVWFAYNPEEWVLQDVSFRVEPGQTVALVGATGAGKSSIISLITRLYDVQRGAIRIDGVDVREMPLDALRRQVAVVLQDVFLFTGDIKGNIRLSNEEISEARIREVARLVNADRFIERLPRGYDEPVTERGSTLSAGERQLLAFARALAVDPAILILDEATANIDTETEALIQDAIEKLTAGRTTIVVAHRLSTIRNADRILVLHKGQVRESGTHEELLALGGLYYQLYQLQFAHLEGRNGADGAAEESVTRITTLDGA